MALSTTKFDIQNHLKTPEERAAYLQAAFEEGDASFITHALNDVARSVGMAKVAEAAGITREGLYKALGEKGDPKLSTLVGVMKALGVRMTTEAATDGLASSQRPASGSISTASNEAPFLSPRGEGFEERARPVARPGGAKRRVRAS